MINKILNIYFSKRLREIESFKKDPEIAQEKVFKRLISNIANSDYGKFIGIKNTAKYLEFTSIVPVVTYEEYRMWIMNSLTQTKGIVSDQNILWYSKSAGTTTSKSKYIPVTKSFLKKGHLQGGKDTLAIMMDRFSENRILHGKTLTLGGSMNEQVNGASDCVCGDISAIMMSQTPWYAKYHRTPSISTAIISDFNLKTETICKECSSQNITSFAGVPSWNLVMLEKILEYNNKSTIPEVWENIELFVHGGISFEPYRDQYKQLFPNPNMKYIETYNASEGFFGIQDTSINQEMLLMCDYDIFFEFMPMDKFGDSSSIVPISGVKCGINYALIISTSAGLWRYMIGDTVKFTSIYPHRIKITGRTKLFLNVFGEEVIIENSDRAIAEATLRTESRVNEYMVVPIFMEIGNKGTHQWIVEFSKKPDDFRKFENIVDSILQEVNSDYEAKRTNNTTLNAPKFTYVEKGTYYSWLDSKGKLGGQVKIPRLSNNRKLADEFLQFAKTNKLIIKE